MSNRTNRPQDATNTKEKQQYHIKTKHYAKADSYTREDQHQIYPQKQKINKHQKYDRVDKYDRYNKFQKNQEYSRSPYSRDQTDTSFSDNNKLDDTITQKKQNARNRGFQMRINNIESIHDKITNLLNLVKNDVKINNLNSNKIKDSYADSNQQNELSKQQWRDKIKKAALNNYDAKENLTTTEQKYKIKAPEESSRDYQRNRTASVINIQRTKQKPNNSILPKNKYLYNNPIDKVEEPVHYADLQFKKYKPNSKWEDRYREIDDRSKPKENNTKTADKDKFNYSSPLSPRIDNKEAEKKMGRITKDKRKDQQQRNRDIETKQILEQTNSAIGKWNNYYEPQQQHSSKQSTYKYERPSLQSKKIEQSIMPMTLVSNTPNERPQNVTNTTKMIDQQIKRIKNKIQQSQSHNYRMQQRLTLDQNENKTSKKNKVGSLTPTNKFQLKVYPVEIDKEQTVRIAEMLSSQAQIDSQIRVARQKFHSDPNENKWKELQHSLKNRGIKITATEIKELITLSPDQHNPFGESQSNTPKNNDLVGLFCAAQQHWQTKLCGCSSLKALKAQGFEAGDMDLNKKGYLQVEDIVCFVNLYTGHFYRNRDIALIYRRLMLLQGTKSQEGVQFQTFMRIVAL